MIRKASVVVLILLLPSLLSAQQQDKEQYVAIPNDILLLTIASPPGCPIQFENARLLLNVQQKSYAFSYDLRNTSAKPISQWQPMFWSSVGVGGTLGRDDPTYNRPILPGEVLRESPERLVPLTPDLRKQLDLDKLRGGMIALVINTVTFADGSRYDNSSYVTAVRSYFEDLATKLNRLENIMRDRRSANQSQTSLGALNIHPVPK